MRRWAGALFASLLFFISAPGQAQSLEGNASVVDGDTLLLDYDKTVHLFGIDAWELQQKCPTPAGKPFPCGSAATGYLRSLVEGRRIHCIPILRVHRKGWIADCYHRGLNLSEAMVFKGWGVALPQQSQLHVEAESRARDDRRGGFLGLPVWEPLPPSDWRAGNRLVGIKAPQTKKNRDPYLDDVMQDLPPAGAASKFDAETTPDSPAAEAAELNRALMQKLKDAMSR